MTRKHKSSSMQAVGSARFVYTSTGSIMSQNPRRIKLLSIHCKIPGACQDSTKFMIKNLGRKLLNTVPVLPVVLITEHTDRLPNGDLRRGRKKLARQRTPVRRPFVSPIMWGKEKWRKRKRRQKAKKKWRKRKRKKEETNWAQALVPARWLRNMNSRWQLRITTRAPYKTYQYMANHPSARTKLIQCLGIILLIPIYGTFCSYSIVGWEVLFAPSYVSPVRATGRNVSSHTQRINCFSTVSGELWRRNKQLFITRVPYSCCSVANHQDRQDSENLVSPMSVFGAEVNKQNFTDIRHSWTLDHN